MNDWFGADRFGVSCQGEEGSEVRLGDGGRRGVFCQIKVDKPTDYDLKVIKIETLLGNSRTIPINKSWILSEGWKGKVNPSGNGTQIKLITLNIPKYTPKSTVELDVEVIENNDITTKKIHTIIFDIVPSPTLLQRITSACY